VFFVSLVDEILGFTVRAFYRRLRRFSNPSMTTEWAVFFFHADPVCKEHSPNGLKIYLLKKEEVFIGFGTPAAVIRRETPPHVSSFFLHFSVLQSQKCSHDQIPDEEVVRRQQHLVPGMLLYPPRIG
jgi:hypothetical protein